MLLSAMGAGKGGERKKGWESARKPGKTNAVRRKRGESHDFSAIALPGNRRPDVSVPVFGYTFAGFRGFC